MPDHTQPKVRQDVRCGQPPSAGGAAETDLLPPLLAPQRASDYHQQFLEEYGPVGASEAVLVAQLARHALQLEVWGAATDASERQAAKGLGEFSLATGPTSQSVADVILAGSMCSDGVFRCDGRGLAHAKAFLRMLETLTKVQRRRKKREAKAVTLRPPPAFASEAACEEYLAERFRSGSFRCGRCRCATGCYIASHRCWECRDCKTQVGLRSGTVMARSPITLWQWFEAIRWLLWRPTLSMVELAAKLGIERLTTVGNMAKRIHAAMAADDCTARLAGLDLHYAKQEDTT